MPEETNLPKSLHELVSQTNDDGKNRKTVGYSVSSYAGVLSALEKAKAIVNNTTNSSNSSSSSSFGVVSRSWTFLSNYGNDNTSVIQNEFYQSDLNQVRVFLKDYMPYVLDCKKDDGTIERTSVVRRDYESLSHLDGGIGVSCSQYPQFPPSKWGKDNLDRCKNGIASSNNGEGFVIGLGVAFNQVVLNYFNHFYPSMKWSENNLKSLAAKGHLCGELMVPKGDNAKVLHSKITVDISQSNTSSYDVFVPVPLLLIDDFKELGYVKVKNNTTEETIDGNKLRFPFSDKKFNHKKCEIEGFTPDAVRDYVKNDSDRRRHIEHCCTGLYDATQVQVTESTDSNGGQQVKIKLKEGRMRFYFLPESQQEVATTVGEIPNEYKDKLFRGVISEQGYYKTETVVVEQGVFQSGDIYWDPSYFTKTNITREQYEKCVRIVWDFEVGNPNADWQRCKDVHDGHGLSYGPYQYTEKSGLLSRVVKKYLDNKTGNYNEHDQILNESELAKGDYKGKTIYANNLSIINALKAVGDDPIMKNVQGQIFLETRAKVALNCMDDTGMKSALGLQMWMYYINHGWSTGYKTSVQNATDEKTKCLALVNAHETRLRRLPNRTDTETGEIYNPWERFGRGWSVFLNAHKRAINADNFNLDKPQIWRNNTV